MKNFFEPETVAIIGASDNENKVGGILVKKVSASGRQVVLVNPKHDFIRGIKVYNKITDFKGNIDLAIIAVPAPIVFSVLEECAEKGIKDIIIISAGFSESENLEEEKKIAEFAEKKNIRILGPNCFGICNPYMKLDLTFSASMPEKGNIAFVSQSGALWSFISDFSIEKFGFSGFASLGNMADLEFSDFIDYFSKDRRTDAIIIYIEKLKDGKRFIEMCKKCKKRIFAVKAGSSKEGSKAAISHTGSLATDFAVYKGALKQAGVFLCDSLEEAFSKATGKELIEKKSTQKLGKHGKKVFIITNAGGAGILAADYLFDSGFEVTQVSDFKNPLDLIGTALSSDYASAFEKIVDKKFYDFIVVIVAPQSMTDSDKIAEEIAAFSKKAGKKVIALFAGGKSVFKATEILRENKISCFNTLDEFRVALKNK